MTRVPIVACFCMAAAISIVSAQSNGTRSPSAPNPKQQAVIELFDAFKNPTSPGCAVTSLVMARRCFRLGMVSRTLNMVSPLRRALRSTPHRSRSSSRRRRSACWCCAGNSRLMRMSVTSCRRCRLRYPDHRATAAASHERPADVRWTVLPGSPSGIALQRRNLSPTALAARDTTGTRFALTGTPAAVRFQRNAVGRVTGFVVDAGDITNIRFEKLK